MKLTNSLKSRHSYSLGLSTAWSPFSSWLVGFSLCSVVLQRQEISFISWSKCLSLQSEEQLLLNVLWAWDEAAKQKALNQDLTALFSMKITGKRIATVSANDKIVKAQDLLHYKQRVRAPPSSISRGRRPELTHKVAKVQVCPVWSNETISSDFLNVIADHYRIVVKVW